MSESTVRFFRTFKKLICEIFGHDWREAEISEDGGHTWWANYRDCEFCGKHELRFGAVKK